MYKLLSIEDYFSTRDLELQNMDNQVKEKCFDDSILLDFKNFDFMEIGQIYDCKILLFGEISGQGEPFVYIGEEMIGRKLFGKLKDKRSSVYYIEKNSSVLFQEVNDIIYVDYSRKDLIQVNELIHPSFR